MPWRPPLPPSRANAQSAEPDFVHTFFGGVPEQVLFDNAKTVVIERDAYRPRRASTRISTACSWLNIDDSRKAVILAQVEQIYFGAVGQSCAGANKRRCERRIRSA